MILSIGVDSIEIHRFVKWNTYSYKNLLRIFSEQEIKYCLKYKNKSAERFAARFAAKEAFFKAFSVMNSSIYIPFLTLCRYVSVQKFQERPVLCVNWQQIALIKSIQVPSIACHLSLTHTKICATAFIVIEKI